MSPLEVSNWELLGMFAVAIPLLSVYGYVLFRLDRLVRVKGYQSPFRSLGMWLAFGVSMALGFLGAAFAPDLCWECSPAKNPEAFRPEHSWTKIGQFARYFFIGSLLPMIVAAAICLLMPRQARRFGERRVRMPWKAVSTLCLAMMAVVTLATVVWRPGFRVWFEGTMLFLAAYRVSADLAKRLAAPGLSSTLHDDPRPAVLYLREFDQEDKAFTTLSYDECEQLGVPMLNPRSWRHPATLEQYFDVEVRREIGPFVALGDPNDYAPPGGASREYFTDDGWKASFRELAQRSRLILIRPGASDNLTFELRMLRDLALLHKLVVVTKPERKRAILPRSWFTHFERKQWGEFSKAAAAAGVKLCSYPGPGVVASFDRDSGVVIATGSATPADYVKAMLGRCERGDQRAENL